MTELPGRKPKDVPLGSDYLELSADIYSTIQKSTKYGLRAKRGEFFPKSSNSSRYRMAYYTADREAVFEIDEVNSSLERQTTYHFREGNGPVLITGYVDYDDNGNKKTLYYLNLVPLEDPMLDDSEEWKKALVAKTDDLRVILGLIKNPLANAALLEQLPQLKS